MFLLKNILRVWLRVMDKNDIIKAFKDQNKDTVWASTEVENIASNCFMDGAAFVINSTCNKGGRNKEMVSLILDHLNKSRKEIFTNKNARGFPLTESTKSLILSRLKEGNTLEDFIQVIDYKCNEWKGTDFIKYLQPSTLFRASKFPEYLVEADGFKRAERSELDKDIDRLMG